MTTTPKTLLDLVRARAESHPTRGFKFLGDGVKVTETLTYEQLDLDARKIAVAIKAAGVKEGARAVLLYSYGLDFIRAFWACAYAGVVAVPVPPPTAAKPTRTLARLAAVAKSCAPDVILTTDKLRDAAVPIALDGVLTLATDSAQGDPSAWTPPRSAPEDVALLQYTSGSTREPKGVLIRHSNMLHNLGLLRAFHDHQEHMVIVSWLPLYHDMGLIRGMMSPVDMGGDCILMSPMDFVHRPFKWLAAASTHRATILGSPNFGLELCTRKVADADVEKLDLSSVRIAFSTAEPIRASTVEHFTAKFERGGFRPDAFRAAYGLAEATVAVTGELEGGLHTWRVSSAALHDGRVVPDEGADASTLVSCGKVLGDQDLVIVDDAGKPAADDRIGEVWLRGPSVGGGYWGNESETKRVFEARLASGAGPYLRTGDLGWRAADGRVAIVGRIKDLIILRGLNYYPQDLETLAEAAAKTLRPGCSTAFSLETEDEAVVIVCEYDETRAAPMTPEATADAVRNAIREEEELRLSAVVLVRVGQIPKTASGKVQRSLARELYLAGQLETVFVWPPPPPGKPPQT